ncbi:MAG: TetR/AcrR family transcriptional regulator [Spirochaetes bacterium]|nr:TetR/AcrR family transcriptional regulator [Spirochaetota bacterium]
MLTKGHRRKQQIIDTAKDMFIKYGFQSTHIGKVCDELRIARGTVYQYFGNKREILYAILDSAEESIDDILDPDDIKDFLKNNNSQKSLLTYINEKIASTIDIIINEPIILKLIFKDIVGIDEGVFKRINEFIEYIVKAIVVYIDEIIKKGFFKKGINPEDTAQIILGGILFMVNNYNNKQYAKLEKNAVETLIDNCFKGVLK